MPDEFDAYRKWLGIPPDKQPPDYYRLLGIPLFEDDPDVIENAANRQMAHVRTYQAGRHSGISQKILNQLATAKICLLDSSSKRTYDDGLRTHLPPEPPLAEPPLEPAPPVAILPPNAQAAGVAERQAVTGPPPLAATKNDSVAEDKVVGTATPVAPGRSTRVGARRRRSQSSSAAIVIATITIIAVVLLFVIVSMLAK